MGLFFAVGGVLELELLRRKRIVEKQRQVEALDNFFGMFDPDGFDIPANYKFDPLNLREKVDQRGSREGVLAAGNRDIQWKSCHARMPGLHCARDGHSCARGARNATVLLRNLYPRARACEEYPHNKMINLL